MEQNIGDRIKRVRLSQIVDGKKITQENFGKQLGVSRSVIKNLEYGVVEPQEPMIKAICATFGVDYFWLTTGEGEMLHESANPLIDRINELMEGENETAKRILRAFAEFSDEDWQLATKFVKSLLADNKKDDPN